MKTAAIYLRMSRDHTGEGEGVQRQREDAEALAAARGYKVTAVLEDNDLSAAGGKTRPGFEELLDGLAQGRFHAVVAWNLDRLTRNRHDTTRLIERAQEARATIALCRGSDLDMSTPAGRLVADILASVARNEIEVKGDRQRRAARQRAEQGKPPAGVRLTGYSLDGTLIPEEAAVVRRAFDLFAAGESLRGIVSIFTTEGVPTRRGRPWNPSALRTMLTNPRYAGLAVYCGAENGARGLWQPIIDESTFRAVQARLSDPRRATNKVGTARRYLGSGLFLCGQCDRPVVSFSQSRYYCRACRFSRSRTHIDAVVLAVVRERLAQPDLADLLANTGRDAEAAAEVTRLRDRLTAIEADYDDGVIDGRRYATARDKVLAQLEVANRKLASRSGTGALAGITGAADPVAAFDSASLGVQRALIDRLLVARMWPAPRGSKTFDPDSITITWRGGTDD